MLSALFIIIYLFVLENSESVFIDARSNIYIKNKLSNTKKLLIDNSCLLPTYTQYNKNILITTGENFNEILHNGCFEELSVKNPATSTLNYGANTIFEKYVKRLKNLLDYRLQINTDKKGLNLRTAYLERGNIDLATFKMRNTSTVPLTVDPIELKNLTIFRLADTAVKKVHLLEKHIFFKNKQKYLLSGAITLNGLVNFQEISISNLSAIYLMGKKVEELLISEINQSFSTELKSLKNFIKNLEVQSICQLPFKYWLRNRDRSDDDLNDINLNDCSLFNETQLSIENKNDNFRVHEVKVNSINGVNIKNLINSSFIMGEVQNIRDNFVSLSPLRSIAIFAERINNASSRSLLNKMKNESLSEIAIDILEVQHLLVDKINEVTVSDAARMSEENVIKGKVTISNLLIRNEVIVKENVVAPLKHPMQVYEEMLIDGNVFIKNIQVESEDCIDITLGLQENNLNETKGLVNSYEVLGRSWRKSEEQVISWNVQFKKGASINVLECQHLNGLREQEFAYSSSKDLSMANVSFKHVHLRGQLQQFLHEDRSTNSIVFDKLIRFSHIAVGRLFLENYNGIAVNDIKLKNLKNLGNLKSLKVTQQMLVRQLNLNWLNERSASTFEKAMRSDQDLNINKLEGVKNMKINKVKVKDLYGKNIEDSFLKQEILAKKNRNNILLTIAERLQVESALTIFNSKINEEDLDYCIDRMKSLHMDHLIEIKRIKPIEVLNVFENLNAQKVLMENLENLFAKALSVSRQQVLAASGKLIADHVKIDYLVGEHLNRVNTSSLIHSDTPFSITGNIYFSSLTVEGKVEPTALNNKAIKSKCAGTPTKMQSADQLLTISGAMLNNESVHIFGSVFWEAESNKYSSVNKLFSNAVAKSNDQTIEWPLLVEQATAIDFLSIYPDKESLIFNKILEILSDCLIDDPKSTVSTVTGIKVFKKKVKAHDMKVLNNITSESFNYGSFDQMIFRLFKKSEESQESGNAMPLAKLSFLHEVEIESLRTQNSNERVQAHTFALTDRQIMPSQLTFKHLIIRQNVSLNELDNLQFDKIIMKRVNIAEPYDVFADVQFNSSITVLTSSSVVMVNGISDRDLVLRFPNYKTTTANLIRGKKSFSSILQIENNLEVNSLRSDYNESFVKLDNTEIFGNLKVEEKVESLNDVLLVGQLHNEAFKLRNAATAEKWNKILPTKVNVLTSVGEPSAYKLTGRFFYFERLNNFEALNNYEVQVAVASQTISSSTTRLDLYVSDAGTACGLTIDCPCRSHLLVDVSSAGNARVVQAKSPNVFFNFHDPRGLFGLRLISEAAPTAATAATDEATPCSNWQTIGATVFWTKINVYGEAKLEKVALTIEGVIAHAQVFLINNDKLYMILAKFYDNASKSYATHSLVYEFHLKNKTVNKCQSIATEGAKTVHIFQVAKTEVYALIGCLKGKAESLLLRFDPKIRQFQLIRTFSTGGSKHIASLSKENKSFVILSNPDIEALQIYIYNAAFDNFYEYQNLYFKSRVSSLHVFYSEDFGQSNAYLTVTTKDGLFYLYQYTCSGKFQMKISHYLEDFQVISPFRIGNENYLFATHKLNTTIFKVVQDSN